MFNTLNMLREYIRVCVPTSATHQWPMGGTRDIKGLGCLLVQSKPHLQLHLL